MTLLRQSTRLVMLTLALGLPGCGRDVNPTPTATGARPATKPTWSEQLADVRAGRSRRIVMARQPVTAAEFSELADRCEELQVLDLEAVEAGADDLAVLAQLPGLQRIRLGGPVDDAGVEQLVKAAELTAVNLPSATFTDRGLELLAQLPKLELLRFHSPNISDDGLAHIAAMPALRFLHLIDVPVTDAGLAHLHSLTRLESFYLDGGRCSEAGLRDLLVALPELHFHRDQLHLPGDPRADVHGDRAASSGVGD